MKLCIYHGNCADGFTSAWAMWRALPDTEFHAGFFGTPPPDCTDREVVLVDFSYKRPVLLEMAKVAKSILILDHHASAEKDLVDLPDNVTTVFDMNRSGARITWEYYHPGTEVPLMILHVEDRDLWRFNLENTREFQSNMFSYEYTFENWDKIHSIMSNGRNDEYWKFISEGSAIDRKLLKDIKELMGVAAYRMVIAGHNVPVMNAPYFYSSEAGSTMCVGEPFAACYWDLPNNERVYSLRSNNDGLDVSEIAVKFGGGGHRNAAGFSIITNPNSEVNPDV